MMSSPIPEVADLPHSDAPLNTMVIPSLPADTPWITDQELAAWRKVSASLPRSSSQNNEESLLKASSETSPITKAKVIEFLDLLSFGYGGLCTNPDKEHQAKFLLHEICSGLIPSALQPLVEEFATGFADAVDTVKKNMHSIPHLFLEGRSLLATENAIHDKQQDLLLSLDQYQALSSQAVSLEKEVRGLEVQLGMAKDKLARCIADRVKYCARARQENDQLRELFQERESRQVQQQQLEKQQAEMLQQNFDFEFRIRSFVRNVKQMLADSKWSS